LILPQSRHYGNVSFILNIGYSHAFSLFLGIFIVKPALFSSFRFLSGVISLLVCFVAVLQFFSLLSRTEARASAGKNNA